MPVFLISNVTLKLSTCFSKIPNYSHRWTSKHSFFHPHPHILPLQCIPRHIWRNFEVFCRFRPSLKVFINFGMLFRISTYLKKTSSNTCKLLTCTGPFTILFRFHWIKLKIRLKKRTLQSQWCDGTSSLIWSLPQNIAKTECPIENMHKIKVRILISCECEFCLRRSFVKIFLN